MHLTLRRGLALAGLFVLGLGLVACGDDGSPSSSSSAAPTVRGGWARASAASQTAGAAYMDITGGTTDDALVGASVPATVAARTEVHETVMAAASTGSTTGAMGGTSGTSGSGAAAMMDMRPVSSVAIAKGATFSLKPGGYHVMLLDLAAPLTVGQTFTVTLTFEKAGRVDVPVEVRAS